MEKELTKLQLTINNKMESEWKIPIQNDLIIHYENDENASLCSQCCVEESATSSKLQVNLSLEFYKHIKKNL